ncbi:MAG: cupin domain-containing protein [Erysipelotrichaceae bacterium]
MKKVVKTNETKTIVLSDLVSRKILAYGSDMMAVEVSFEQGGIGDPHSHPHAQITYVLEGKFIFDTPEGSYPVEKGDSLYFAPDSVHGAKCLEKGKVLDVFTPLREDFI